MGGLAPLEKLPFQLWVGTPGPAKETAILCRFPKATLDQNFGQTWRPG